MLSCLLISFSYLPATSRLSVVRKVVADPLIDLTERHPFPRGAIYGKGDEAGVAIRGFAVSVLRSFFLIQCGSWIQMHHLLPLSMSVMVHVVVVMPKMTVVVSYICLLDGCSHAELWKPVHGGEAAPQLRGHDARRSRGVKKEEEGLQRRGVRTDLLLAH